MEILHDHCGFEQISDKQKRDVTKQLSLAIEALETGKAKPDVDDVEGLIEGFKRALEDFKHGRFDRVA